MAFINPKIRNALAGLFGSEVDSDCVVIFCREAVAIAREEAGSGQRHAAESEARDVEVFGEPLPGHRIVLRFASEQFAFQLDRWCNAHDDFYGIQLPKRRRTRAPDSDTADDATHGASIALGVIRGSRLDVPQVLVPLRGPEEVPAARAVLEFAYSGEVPCESVRAVLGIRHLGSRLQIRDCAAACDEALVRSLEDAGALLNDGDNVEAGTWAAAGDHSSGDDSEGDDDNDGRSSSGEEEEGEEEDHQEEEEDATVRRAMELYEWESMWPNMHVEPGFGAVVSAASSVLFARFRDVLEILNTPGLLKQFLAAPPLALNMLLVPDGLRTDCESSVLQLLAGWMASNYHNTTAAIRTYLCRAVRLTQLSRPYLALVLPALSADHEKHPEGPAGWFQLNVAQAGFVANLACAPDHERWELVQQAAQHPAAYRLHEPNLHLGTRRRQSIPPEGLELRWRITRQELARELAALRKPGDVALVGAVFSCNASQAVSAWGFQWEVLLSVMYGQPRVGVCVRCRLPPVFSATAGGRLSGGQKQQQQVTSSAAEALPVAVPFDADVVVHAWQPDGAAAATLYVQHFRGALVWSGTMMRRPDVLPLQPLPRLLLEQLQRQRQQAVAQRQQQQQHGQPLPEQQLNDLQGGVQQLQPRAQLRRQQQSQQLQHQEAFGSVISPEDCVLSSSLSCWALYLKNDKIRGTLKLLQPRQ